MPIPGSLLSRLSQVLARLYSDQPSARTRAVSAGLDITRIAFDPVALNTWTDVLRQAEEEGRTSLLLDQVATLYPNYLPLDTARQAYADWVAAGRPPIPVPSRPPRIFISHATAGTPDAPALPVLVDFLTEQGFTVWAEPAGTPTLTPWSRRLLGELGTCDGAVVLLNQAVLDDPTSWVYDDLRLLRWRSWLEADVGFALVVLCLNAPCAAALQGEPWDLLEISTAAPLQHASDDALRAQLAAALQPLARVRRRDWRLADLLTALEQRLRATQITPTRLQQAAQDLAPQMGLEADALSVEGIDWVDWWGRALLCGGPSLLRSLADNLNVQLIPEAKMGLRELVAPTWVDLRAAGLIPRLGTHPQVTRRAFYVNGSLVNNRPATDPRFIAEMYLRRACWRAAGALCWPLAVVPPRASSRDEALARVRTQLENIFGIDAMTAADGWFDEDVTGTNPWEEIRRCVAEGLQAHKPTILLLPGPKINDTTLQNELREKCGDVTFFFVFVDPEIARIARVPPLQPAITGDADKRAYDDWRALGGELRPV